jgi:hypothetical protein
VKEVPGVPLSSRGIVAGFYPSSFGKLMRTFTAELTLQTKNLHHWVHYQNRK